MITVEIHKNTSGQIASLSVSDHSGFAEEGRDIICAGVSTLVYTAIEALHQMCGLSDFYRIVEDSDGNSVPFSTITLPVSSLNNAQLHSSQIIMRTVEIGFLLLEESARADYGNQFIQVTTAEDDTLEV